MSHVRWPLPGTWAVVVLALGAGACAGIKSPSLNPDPSDSGVVDVPATGGTGGTPPPATMDARPAPDIVIVTEGGVCTPTTTCTPPNGRYCGVVGNGCFGTIDCGAWPTASR